MRTIVGKLFLCFLFCTTSASPVKIHLEARGVNGEKFDHFAIGQPFMLEVGVEGVSGSVPTPIIKGLEHFSAKRTGYYMSSINGKSTTKFSFQVRIDEPGEFTIGPAIISHQQKKYESDCVTVVVKENTSASQSSKSSKSTTSQHAFLHLASDIDHAVVGQKMSGTLRFYYQDPSIKLVHIGKPDETGFEIKNIKEPQGGLKEINGINYQYAQWQWDMFPTKSGQLIIPAYYADYEIQNQNSRALGNFFIFVNGLADRKRVYSNAIKIQVDPLPPHDEKVDAIGSFKEINASIKPSIAKEGEGIVLAIEVVGEGNLGSIATPIVRLPQELKCYESNSSIIEEKNGELTKKRFEYIVQGMKCGDWEIPKQSFTYFDVEKHAYKKLSTSPLVVTIVPNTHAIKNELIDRDEGNRAATANHNEQYDTTFALNIIGPWYEIKERAPISWWIFYLLFVLPLIYFYSSWIMTKFFPYNSNYRKKMVYRKARKQIKMYMAAGDAPNIYHIFIQLFAVLFNNDDEIIASENIRKYLKARGLSDEALVEWDEFFGSVTQAAFCSAGNEKNNNDFCKAAQQWINRLENIV